MSVKIIPMSPQHYAQAIALWRASEGIGLSEADEPAPIADYLRRNPGLSFIANERGILVGAILCGHDGRRGFIHHLAVSPTHRRRGVGTALAERCLSALRKAGIHKCHIFVFAGNESAHAFWKDIGWMARDDLVVMSRYTDT